MKQFGIGLALLFLACWFGGSSAQQCACNDTACRNTAMQNDPTTQMCCQWVDQYFDTNAASLDDPQRTPLGFLLAEYRGTDSNKPDLCVQFDYPRPLRSIRYVVVAVQTDTTICVRRRNGGNDDEPTCGSGGVFFCQSFTFGNNIQLEFYCGVGQGSCPVNDEVFYFRPNITLLDTDDEYFCDNIDRTLPNSLVLEQAPDPNVNVNPVGNEGNGAAFVNSLLPPALLLLTLLVMLLFH